MRIFDFAKNESICIRVSYAVIAGEGELIFYVKFDVDFRSGLHFDLTGLT